MNASIILLVLSAIGIGETVYLIRTRRAMRAPVCPIDGGCSTVLESKYNKLFFISNDTLGLLFYLGTAGLSVLMATNTNPLWRTLITLAVAAGSLMSLVFTYLQWRVIRAWCFWCLMSAITIWLMGGILILTA